jgi:acyl carrier protein
VNREHIFAEVLVLARTAEQRLVGQRIALDETPLTTYGVTSLALLQLVSLVEDRFGITITDAEALRASSALALVELIEHKLRAAGSEDTVTTRDTDRR